MSVLAVAKGVNMSPRKVGVVAALIRGRSVQDALTILAHVPRASAIPVRKAVESARANAEHNHNLKPDTLMITEISVSPGTPMKRMRPAAQGRGLPFLRRTCHIRVVVDGETRVVKKAAKPATVKKEAK
jgi:large subunit ribosomal protein L22